MKIDSCGYSNQGGREYNEDNMFFQVEGDFGLFVVADGLGGHEYGAIASETVCSTLSSNWSPDCQDRKEWLQTSLVNANNEIIEIQKTKNSILKSTAVALAIDEEKAYWANVGDSRLYFIHNYQIYSYTDDHSVAYKKFRAGEISRDDIGQDEDQSSLLRTLGSKEKYEPQLYESDVLLSSGDAFLLCSDGVWEYVKDEEMLIDYLKAEDSRQWAELMLLRLMDRIDGKNDNLTLITVIME